MLESKRGPEYWGPAAWQYLESVVLNYPVDPTIEDQDSYRDFFYSMVNTLPCDECAEHYYDNLVNIPIRLQNRYELTTWLIEIHNSVNTANKKPLYSLQQFLSKYDLVLQDLFL